MYVFEIAGCMCFEFENDKNTIIKELITFFCLCLAKFLYSQLLKSLMVTLIITTVVN